jgi:H+/Cl- antiporter ClcA
MGIAAMTAGTLRLPMTATLLTTLFLGPDGLAILPLVIVSAVVSYVFVVRLTPPPVGDRPSATEPPAHRQVR